MARKNSKASASGNRSAVEPKRRSSRFFKKPRLDGEHSALNEKENEDDGGSSGDDFVAPKRKFSKARTTTTKNDDGKVAKGGVVDTLSNPNNISSSSCIRASKSIKFRCEVLGNLVNQRSKWRKLIRSHQICNHELQRILSGTSASIFGQRSANGGPSWLHSMERYLEKFEGVTTVGPCSSRVTAVDWHPSHPKSIAVGSKHGSVAVWNVDQLLENKDIVSGEGPGWSCGAIVFDKRDSDYLYVASMHCFIKKLNIHTRDVDHLAEITFPEVYNRWWVSVDVSGLDGVALAGDSKGGVTAISQNTQEKVWNMKLNKGKTHHIEFDKSVPWLFTTASVDHSVRLWDLRSMKTNHRNIAEPLETLEHNHACNIASFSGSGSRCLMTSDQKDEIRVYQGPMFNQICSIKHPHRQFQHLTPIRASWHPFLDLIVAGRYPEANSSDLRTVDLFYPYLSTRIVEPWHQITPKWKAPKLVSISKFNCTGDILATASGPSLTTWRPDFDEEIRKSAINAAPDSIPKLKPKSRMNTDDLKSKKKSKTAAS